MIYIPTLIRDSVFAGESDKRNVVYVCGGSMGFNGGGKRKYIFSLDVSLFGNTSSECNKQDEYHKKFFTLVTFLAHIFTQLIIFL